MATLTWRGSATNIDGAGTDSTPTFSIDIGTAASDRWVVVMITGREPQWTGITVNGTSMPNVVNYGGGQHPVLIAWGLVTTGSGTVTVALSTSAGSASWAMPGCWTITGTGGANVVQRDGDGGGTNAILTTVGSFTLTTAVGDFVIAGTNCLTAGSNGSVTWSQGTERSDFGFGTQSYSAMDFIADGSSEVVQATHAQGITNPAISIASLYVQGVDATLTTTTGSAVAGGGEGAMGAWQPPRRWAAPAPVDTNTLGSGIHSVFLHDRGGQRRIGAIIDNTMVRWERVRDDISTATIIVSPEGVMACSDVLREMSVGRHEIVIYRNKERVWEGPITRITWKSSSIEITAHDICHYLTRTIMRSGYDNRYSAENSKVGPVTERMRTILVNELQRKEALTPPYRILNYLDVRTNENTVNTARLSLPYQRTVWEEMDEMAAKSGLDYTVVGRRLALWDVHDNIGQLPLLSDKDFESELIVTAYGMELCTYSGVTDGEGRWGAVGTSQDPYYGEVELLHTMYGEGLDAADPENPTQEELDALARELTSQAQRNLAGRYPTPTIVRIPDGTGLNPNAPVTITQLVPGVRVPIRATLLSLTLEQEQKLDRLAVEQTAGGETVSVTLSPAPGSTPWDDSTDSMSEDE
jgi:hypothetical protein